jgi:ribonuclease HI
MREDATEDEIADAIHAASQCIAPDRTDITIYDDDEKMKAKISVLRGYALGTTNNRMEMHAILAAIEAMSKPCAIRIVSDSEWAIGAFTTWNVKANRDLVQRYRAASRGFKVMFEHVEGHSGHALNEWADKLADYKGNPNLEV